MVALLVAAAMAFVGTYIQLRKYPASLAVALAVFFAGQFLIHRVRRHRTRQAEKEQCRHRAACSSYNRELAGFKEMGDPNTMLALSPEGFERFVLRYFQFLGYDATETPAQNDGGIDGVVRKNGHTGLVQCKRYAKPINQAPVREFLGVLTKMNADAGYFVTTSSFGPGARRFAEGTIVTLIDGESLTNMIQQLPYIDPVSKKPVDLNGFSNRSQLNGRTKYPSTKYPSR